MKRKTALRSGGSPVVSGRIGAGSNTLNSAPAKDNTIGMRTPRRRMDVRPFLATRVLIQEGWLRCGVLVIRWLVGVVGRWWWVMMGASGSGRVSRAS
ncbi:Uncharacterised protein [Dermatophilus congolensis]|uniref:Uncharacterized protein n=1 Tax=Dermatophilus congolensis TaxID=1863 RepID=A0AA46H122_9MICO|nr:Uncharacterised protein [Dermatophilus congolensis]